MKVVFSAMLLSLTLAQVSQANQCPVDTGIVCQRSFIKFCFETGSTPKKVSMTSTVPVDKSTPQNLDQAQFDGVLPGPITVSARQMDPSVSERILNYTFNINTIETSEQGSHLIAEVTVNGQAQPPLACRPGSDGL